MSFCPLLRFLLPQPLVAATILVVGAMACAPQSRLQEDSQDFQEEVARLERKIAENPSDTRALRDLGAIHVRTKRTAKGHRYLRKAFTPDQNDPKTLFYLGIASERIGKRQTAQRLYAKYADVPEDSRFRTLLRGRHEALVRREIRQKMSALMVQEKTLNTFPNVVAVLPLIDQGDNERYASLGHGLSKIIAADLANVEEFTLVNRFRLQSLLDEIKLSQSEYINPSAAPRIGQLLGAGRVVVGTFNVSDNETLRIDLALVDSDETAGAVHNLKTYSGALNELFQLEQRVTFRVVDQLGAELSAGEREQIERMPTRNLQAFLAYSRGLAAEAQGNYEAAAQAFQQAQELDPGFSQAADKQEAAAGLSAAGEGTTQALQAAPDLSSLSQQVDLTKN